MSDEEPTVESLRERLDAVAERLDAAETEADLDEVEAEIEQLEADVDAADLPEPDDEDETPPAEALQSDIESIEDDLDAARGPYQSDVETALADAIETVEDGEWTDDGASAVADAVAAYVDAVDDHLDDVPQSVDAADDGGGVQTARETLESILDALESHALDPDEDAETIAALVEATEALQSALDEAEEWDDLTVREQLQADGFYDVLDHTKDYPPEWSALKVYEKRAEVEPILTALETFDSDFMEEHCLDALERLGPEAAIDPMLARAEKRDKRAIAILGKIGSEEPVDTLLEYVDGDVGLQLVTFRALGEIGTSDAVQPLADQLLAEERDVRSAAARALGLIGDTRAVDPLADVLDDDGETGTVRASAAWALVQIGTEEALTVAGEYAEDREYLVQTEAQKARDATAAA